MDGIRLLTMLSGRNRPFLFVRIVRTSSGAPLRHAMVSHVDQYFVLSFILFSVLILSVLL